MEKKVFIFTIDFEEWYHIEYIKKYNFDCRLFSYSDKISFFTNYLNKTGIKFTIFVVSSIISKNLDFLKKIAMDGNEIGCHTYYHEKLTDITVRDFLNDLVKAKNDIEEKVNCQVVSFRAPSFSSTKEQTESLSSIGFKYDSSYINSRANSYYCKKEFSDWVKVSNGIFCQPNTQFKEIEIPTIKFFGIRFPIGGGGFFRILPFWFFKILLKKYLKSHDYYLFFIHPYEISGETPVFLKQMKLKDRLRMNIGRKNLKKKVYKLIDFALKNNFDFKTIREVV